MLPKRRIAFFVGILAAAVAAAQSTNFELGRVDFWRPDGLVDHWIVVKADGTAGAPISGNMKTTAWKKLVSGAVEKKPVAYVSGCRPRISACFVKNGGATGDCANPNSNGAPASTPADYFVRGTVLDPSGQPTGLHLPAARLQKTASNNLYEYPVTSVSGALPAGRVQYVENFRIRWEWSVTSDPNGTWSGCGISENPLYVTRSLPKRENPGVGYRHFHTLLHIGCKYADGATSDEAMIQGVWTHFEGRAVARADGAPLKYYGNWSGGNLASRTDDLLERKDGMCLAWTRLLLDVFKMQGFQESGNVTTVKPRESQYMLIKKWKQDVASGTSGNSKYPFKNIEGTPFYLNNSYNWEYREVLIESPSNSQNNNNPQSDFGIHIFVKIKELFYDPSYGVFYGASNTIEDPLIPMEMIQILPIMDDMYISAYTIKPVQNTVHNIQLNNFIDSDFIFIDDLQAQSY